MAALLAADATSLICHLAMGGRRDERRAVTGE